MGIFDNVRLGGSTSLSGRSTSTMGNLRRSMADPSRNVDWILMFATVGLSIIGAIAVYSCTRPRLLAQGLDPYYFLQRQIIYLIVAAVAMVVLMATDYEWLRGRSEFLFGASIVALILVLVAGTVRG
ncbi:MAG: FtsW/RodA/SpoVE family cell cycle protein, partial [Ilumatobacteraceae bacterium]|nr:FtsW/RodA/SpoVE family cell cycle protein [Ilumatobacteraceae bacterium]